jgi:23S rRNA maturation mini-RNase III
MYMMKLSRYPFFMLCLIAVFSACIGTPVAAQGGTESGTSTGGASSGSTGGSSGQPGWIRAPYSVFNEAQYVAAVGTGNDTVQAERNAFANLTAVFGQSIQVSETLTNNYQEMIKSGAAASWTENTSLDSVIQTSTSLEALLGSEIRERYNDRGTWYAAAVMERAKAARMYTDVINANLTMINNLTTMSDAEKNSIDGFARYQFAGVVSDINVSYGNVLKYLGAAVPARVGDGSTYRMEADTIARTIPVAVVVRNDRNNRVQAAIAKSLADRGFRSGGNNSRYRVEAELTLEEAPSTQNVFVRYTLTANFIDARANNAVLIPYDLITGREGHSSLPNAENRALTTVERKIDEEYAERLNDYLSRLLPKK